MLKKSFFLAVVMLFAVTAINAQQSFKMTIVGFYNLENLYDTINDPQKNDEEFLPQGKNAWNTEKYITKLHNMAYAISTIGADKSDKYYSPDGVMVLGVSEIENRHVLEDLVKQPEIVDRNYQIVHYDSPDRRGVDVALLYNPKYFRVIAYPPQHESDVGVRVSVYPALYLSVDLAPVRFVGVIGAVARDTLSGETYPAEILAGKREHIGLRTAEYIGIVSGAEQDIDEPSGVSEGVE